MIGEAATIARDPIFGWTVDSGVKFDSGGAKYEVVGKTVISDFSGRRWAIHMGVSPMLKIAREAVREGGNIGRTFVEGWSEWFDVKDWVASIHSGSEKVEIHLIDLIYLLEAAEKNQNE